MTTRLSVFTVCCHIGQCHQPTVWTIFWNQPRRHEAPTLSEFAVHSLISNCHFVCWSPHGSFHSLGEMGIAGKSVIFIPCIPFESAYNTAKSSCVLDLVNYRIYKQRRYYCWLRQWTNKSRYLCGASSTGRMIGKFENALKNNSEANISTEMRPSQALWLFVT